MSGAERVYRVLLRAYPGALETEYGREMLLAFRDARRDRRVSEVRFWIDIGWDVARSARPGLSLNVTALLAMIIGVMQAGNAVAEATAGGVSDRTALSIAILAAIVVAGALLLRGGVALWRRGHAAAPTARRTAVICVALFALVAIYDPMVSAFARALGLTFPLALLLVLLPRRRDFLAG